VVCLQETHTEVDIKNWRGGVKVGMPTRRKAVAHRATGGLGRRGMHAASGRRATRV